MPAQRNLTLVVIFCYHYYSCDSLVLSSPSVLCGIFYRLFVLLQALLLHSCSASDQLLYRQCKPSALYFVSDARNREDHSVCLVNLWSLEIAIKCANLTAAFLSSLCICVSTMNRIWTTHGVV